MSNELDDVARSLFLGHIPHIWRKLAPDTLKTLGNWMVYFLRRFSQYTLWVSARATVSLFLDTYVYPFFPVLTPVNVYWVCWGQPQWPQGQSGLVCLWDSDLLCSYDDFFQVCLSICSSSFFLGSLSFPLWVDIQVVTMYLCATKNTIVTVHECSLCMRPEHTCI